MLVGMKVTKVGGDTLDVALSLNNDGKSRVTWASTMSLAVISKS